MDFGYALTPFVAWLSAGIIKFMINSIKAGKPAYSQIGYGGLPSSHSAIVSSVAALIAIREGFNHPAFGVALALAFVVMMDANSLRRQIGRQAAIINRLSADPDNRLRERMGHSRVEIGAGILVGILSAWLVDRLFVFFTVNSL